MNSNSLTKAFASSQRSLISCKASVSNVSDALLSNGPAGIPTQTTDLSRAQEQERHFKGWVYSSIRPIAQKIAGQPIHVGRIKSKRKLMTKNHQPVNVEPLEDHPLLDLIHDPNDLMTAWSLVYVTICSLELTGRCLWWITESNGKKQILPIPTSWIKGIDGSTSITAFRVQPPHSGEQFPIPADECCYFAYPNPSDPRGAISPLQAVGAAVDADEQIQYSQVVMFRNGIHPSHVVICGKDSEGRRPRLTGAQQRQIISAIQKRYAGTTNHGEPLILDGLIEDVKKLSNTPAEMDWLNSGKSTKSRIMQGFGTNPIIAGEIEGANRASSTVAETHFCNYTINPKIELISQTLTAWLRPIFGNDLVIWIEPCVPDDADMKFKWVSLLSKSGVLTGDELRELSPFDLKIGQFGEPITSNPRDPQVDEAMGKLTEAMDGMKQWDSPSFPNRIADNILKASDPKMNGSHK